MVSFNLPELLGAGSGHAVPASAMEEQGASPSAQLLGAAPKLLANQDRCCILSGERRELQAALLPCLFSVVCVVLRQLSVVNVLPLVLLEALQTLS